ncbi:alkaline phosphatase family protein [Embleya scabrispora]|uniref:Alkaline phosphatase family protein n=1 Tax=Embleya scabrispora TaxID=159449 RepID=A0A1T3NV59_9ACTN|nr:nucleotide pyrophosphatase/phosphodiesterase family protein [Embleya scabrispora]OPC80706.1 alkaline phosphatase family protein [Embleya scabrispora]
MSTSVWLDEQPPVPLPRYGAGALCDLLPSIAASLGMAGERNILGLAPARAACVFLIDGLGWEVLRAHPVEAPYLHSLLAGSFAGTGTPLTAGFPATTATSLASFGTGLTPGVHGLVGYAVAMPGRDRLMNQLRWAGDIEPRAWQPYPSVLERAAAAGITVAQVNDAMFEHTPLTRAALAGGRYFGAEFGAPRIEAVHRQLAQPGPVLIYTYASELDRVGHGMGVDSPEWRAELRRIDGVVRAMAEGLPADSVLYVTADHGMVDVAPEQRVDVDADPGLSAGVALLGGEARARHVYTRPGAARDVYAIWDDMLGDRMWVVTRDEAIESGWFGPKVEDRVRERIGDIVAAAFGDVAVVASRREPGESRLTGVHGSMTAAEQLIPLLEVRS